MRRILLLLLLLLTPTLSAQPDEEDGLYIPPVLSVTDDDSGLEPRPE